ncbi:MAG: restriction endonuclease subunit S [Campylobacter sp.]|nr:restriction endonuclease subunit S [Campylobacter sp.]
MSPLNQKISSIEWGEFRIGDLFDVSGSKTTSKSYLEKIGKGDYPYITTQAINNGIAGFYNYFTEQGNCLTIDSAVLGTCFWQNKNFSASDHVEILRPKNFTLNQKIALFFISLLNKNASILGYSYGMKRNQSRIKNENILLPITHNGEIDFEFMESFIAELEAERVAELEAYLAAASLKDYELTADELSALSKFENYNWGEFRVGDLFEIKNTFSFNKEKLTDGNEYDYVTRTSNNQGILQSTGFVNARNLNEAGIWSLGLLQMDFFYRQRQWYAGQFVRKIIPKIKLTQNSILFFTTLLNSQKNILLSVLVRDVDKTFKNLKIKLPVTANDEIDFEFMNNFINAIKKLVIKDVVLYADNKIKATKSIVSSNQ